jgi:hypothetical protein
MPTRPFEAIAIDLIALDGESLAGNHYLFHGYCLVTKTHMAYAIQNRSGPILIRVFKLMDQMIKRRYNTAPTFVHMDKEAGYGFANEEGVAEFCKEEGITLQVRAPDTAEQSGHAERSGKMLITVARSLQVTSNLPLYLCEEMYVYAAYLLNRTPVKALNWKTPFEATYGKQPSLAHLRIYGCRAYYLRKQPARTDKLSPRALIGYLVGVDSRNIYRIWVPKASSRGHRGKVIRTRDVTFDEQHFFGDADEDPLSGIQLKAAMEEIEEDADADTEQESDEEVHEDLSNTVPVPSTKRLLSGDTHGQAQGDWNPYPSPVSLIDRSHQSPGHRNSTPRRGRAPTPSRLSSQLNEDPSISLLNLEDSRISSDTAGDSRISSPDPGFRKRKYKTNQHLDGENVLAKRTRNRAANAIQTYWNTFVAASLSDKLSRSVTPSRRVHRDQLPPVPRFWADVLKLPDWLRAGFIAACHKELETIKRKGTYKVRAITELPPDTEVIPLMWVFTYKLEAGFLVKFKARIVVRGDLQTTVGDTHAATLAIRIFRALMAIAAYFNMEIRQYDAVNAFTNAFLPSPILTWEPEGFRDGAHCWELIKALYGLRISPLLWYKDFTSTLKDLGLRPILDAPCLWMNDKIIVFFYVDDIITMALPGYSNALDEFERKLKERYEITDLQGREIKTFCGINTHRDRENGHLWLSQKDYIEMIYNKFKAPMKSAWNKTPSTPLPLEELVPSTESKNEENSHRYSQIVGSIGYAAGATRPDVAKAHSKLAEFLTNPGPKHLSAAYQCLAYLYYSRDLALHYSKDLTTPHLYEKETDETNFFGATDASYADHKATRKSSQGYIFFLFGGPIDWKATLQRCVVKSTTEAELMSLSTGYTEYYWWLRIFKNLGLEFDEQPAMYCDNKQTIRLLTADSPQLKTTLRHVDIHHHWLREQALHGTVSPAYINTNSQPADGLTKLLSKQKHQEWIKLLHLEPVQTPASPTILATPSRALP